MELQLINTEDLAEARLYRASRSFNTLDGQDIADLLYLNTLATFMMMQDEDQRDFAMDYAKKTVMYGTYSLFRTHATDMYMLAYTVSHPDNDNIKLADSKNSKRYLKDLMFESRKHIYFLRKFIAENYTKSEAISYLFRLETQLRIKDSRYKRWRRLIQDWKNLKYAQKQLAIAQIVQELRRKGAGAGRASEIMYGLSPMLKNKKFLNTEPEKKSGGGLAGAVAGAVAGRYVAGKLNKMDNKKAKNLGTGIGAIAGYWANRNRK